MRKWYVKDRYGRYLSNNGLQFTRQFTEHGEWKYHTKQVEISHSKRGAKSFDKQKNAVEFLRRYPELKTRHESGEIFLVEE